MAKDAIHPAPDVGHEARDRELFDTVAEAYARKDTIPSSRIARRHRLLQTIRAIPLPPNARLLEVGCGAGFSAPYLQGKFESFWGIDYSEKLIEYARQHNARPGVTFSTANIKDLSTQEQFDVVFMIGVLHHIDDMPQAVAQMVRLLKPGGWLVANEPHPANPIVSGLRKMRKKLDTKYSDEQREPTGAEMRRIYESSGLTNVRVVPQGLFSTPFAEVPMKPQFFAKALSWTACTMDRGFEALIGRTLYYASWNLIIAGQKPAGDSRS